MPVTEALSAVLAGPEPLPEEMVALDAAHHRVLARDVAALRTQPPQPMSAMDGYAVRSADAAAAAARLDVIGEVAAGRPFERAVGKGEAVRIFTGGVVPEGADAVIIQEDTVVEDGGITITEAAADTVTATPRGTRRARDGGADILITTGGASVGDHDLVKQSLEAEGVTMAFWRIAMRPGKPMMHGRLGALRVIGLPGNPVSSFVCGFLFLVPLIRALSGFPAIHPAHEPALLRP